MRKKCHDYLSNPSPALLAELTTMEQEWVKNIEDGAIKKPSAQKPAPASAPLAQKTKVK
tara:strand:- start:383 stop:559 length:177 start_codon:yes stop_codon:yes gene_type:complete